MADNVELNLGVGGKTIATDDIGGIQHELVKVEFGTDGNATQVSASNPLPVTDNAVEVSVASIDLKTPTVGQKAMAASSPVVIASDQSAIPISGSVSTGGLTDAQLRAVPVPISGAGDASAANQVIGNATLAAIDAGIPVALGQTVMANSMPVVLASNQSAIPVTFSGSPAIDNTQLYNNTIVATGVISGIDTTGYESILAQISGVWGGNIIIEGSADNSIWQQLLTMNVNDISMTDIIVGNGIYQVKATSKFIRLNVTQLIGSVTVIILGRIGTGINGADRLSLAMDKNNNLPLYISEIDSKKDTSKALIPSDAPAPVYSNGNLLNAVLCQVDTTGYQSVSLQLFGTWTGTVQFEISNDGVTWYLHNGIGIANPPTTVLQTLGNGIWLFIAAAKYFRARITAFGTGVIQAIAFLRQQPSQAIVGINLQYINGVAPLTGGITGTLAVGGNLPVGTAPSLNPIPLAIDTSGLTRRILTDTSGRLINSVDQTGTSRVSGSISPAASSQNVASTAVQDTSQFEGQSFMELLGQMLLELRINNQLLSELPVALQSQNGKLDEPSLFRNEQSVFAN